MSLTGSVAAVNLGYVLPCACALQQSEFHWWPWYNESADRWMGFKDTFPPLLCLIFGLVAGSLSTLQTVFNALDIHMGFF